MSIRAKYEKVKQIRKDRAYHIEVTKLGAWRLITVTRLDPAGKRVPTQSIRMVTEKADRLVENLRRTFLVDENDVMVKTEKQMISFRKSRERAQS